MDHLLSGDTQLKNCDTLSTSPNLGLDPKGNVCLDVNRGALTRSFCHIYVINIVVLCFERESKWERTAEKGGFLLQIP